MLRRFLSHARFALAQLGTAPEGEAGRKACQLAVIGDVNACAARLVWCASPAEINDWPAGRSENRGKPCRRRIGRDTGKIDQQRQAGARFDRHLRPNRAQPCASQGREHGRQARATGEDFDLRIAESG